MRPKISFDRTASPTRRRQMLIAAKLLHLLFLMSLQNTIRARLSRARQDVTRVGVLWIVAPGVRVLDFAAYQPGGAGQAPPLAAGVGQIQSLPETRVQDGLVLPADNLLLTQRTAEDDLEMPHKRAGRRGDTVTRRRGENIGFAVSPCPRVSASPRLEASRLTDYRTRGSCCKAPRPAPRGGSGRTDAPRCLSPCSTAR